MNGVHQTRRKPTAELYGYFETFPIKILTGATDALHAIRQTPFMIGSYSNKLRSDLEFEVPVIPDLDVPGIGGLKNCTIGCSPIVPVPSRSGLAVSRLASLNAHTRRRYRDGSIDVDGHPYGRSIEQAERRLLCFRSGPQHPEPSSESSVLR